MYGYFNYKDELYHHGVLGMKWGNRNGPPYPLSPNRHSSAERKAGWRKSLNSSGGGTSASKNRTSKNSTSKNSTSKNVVRNKSKAVTNISNALNNEKTKENLKKVAKGLAIGAGVAAGATLGYYAYKAYGDEVVEKLLTSYMENEKLQDVVFKSRKAINRGKQIVQSPIMKPVLAAVAVGAVVNDKENVIGMKRSIRKAEKKGQEYKFTSSATKRMERKASRAEKKYGSDSEITKNLKDRAIASQKVDDLQLKYAKNTSMGKAIAGNIAAAVSTKSYNTYALSRALGNSRESSIGKTVVDLNLGDISARSKSLRENYIDEMVNKKQKG